MWKITRFLKTGTRNRVIDLKCQDSVYSIEENGIQAITLADGSGTDNYAQLGAEHSCQTVAKLLVENFNELFNMEKTLLQFNIIANIQSELYELCKKHCIKLEKLQSTILGIAIDNENKRFLALHLGDGTIQIKKNNITMTMSYPENGANKSETYLTSEHGVGKHIRIYKGQIDDIDQFALLSDGWMQKKDIEEGITYMELLDNVDEDEYCDDISFIALNKDN